MAKFVGALDLDHARDLQHRVDVRILQEALADRGFVHWLDRAARLGETIIARTGTAEWTGRFEGIDEGGSLILTTAAGRQSIPAADVFF